jgi:transposase, IS30 family
MGVRERQQAIRAMRGPMRSPGRPPGWRREHRQRFWEAIAGGVSSEEAAAVAGVASAVGARWFREGGGMPTISPAPLSGRYLPFVERDEIAILHAQCCGVCARSLAALRGRCVPGGECARSGRSP